MVVVLLQKPRGSCGWRGGGKPAASVCFPQTGQGMGVPPGKAPHPSLACQGHLEHYSQGLSCCLGVWGSQLLLPALPPTLRGLAVLREGPGGPTAPSWPQCLKR